MEAFGPASIRPGISTDSKLGGNSMSIQLGLKVVDRLGKESVSTLATDLRTFEDEFDSSNFSVISQVNLKVGKGVKVKNWVTGREETVDTLLSKEGGEPAETWIWEGDASGRVYAEVLEKYHKVASQKGDISAVWVSHVEETKKTQGKNARIYKLQKIGDNDAILTSYTAGGSGESMWNFMDLISDQKHDRSSSLHGTTAFFNPKQNISHKNIYESLTRSLLPVELERGKNHLQRFREELDIPDNIRMSINQQKENRLKEKMLENGDVKAGLAMLAHAAVRSVLGEGKAIVEARRDMPSTRNDFIRSISHGMVAIPNLIDHTGRLIDPNDVVWNKSDNDDVIKNKKTKETDIQTSEQVAQQIIEPAVAGIIGLLPLMSSIQDEMLVNADVTKQQYMSVFGDTGIVGGNNDKLFAGSIENMRDLSEEERIWQEFMKMIFTPVPVKEEEIINGEMLFSKSIGLDKVEEEGEFLDTQRRFSDMLTRLMPIMNAGSINESQKTESDEGLTVLKSEFQKGLEVIVELMEGDLRIEIGEESKEETVRQQKVEYDVIQTGKEVLGIILKGENIPFDNLAKLSFLLHVYNDENSSPEIKHLLSALIYKQLEKLKKDEELIREYPQLASIFEKFQALSPEAKFLETRFDKLISVLADLYPDEFLNLNVEDGKDFINKVIFAIFKIMQLPEQFSFERPLNLIYTDNYKPHIYKSHKKKKTKLASHGIIYTYRTCYNEWMYDKIKVW